MRDARHLFVSLAVPALAAACAGPPRAGERPPAPAAARVPQSPLPGERIRAALARHERVTARRVEVTVAPEREAPRAPPATVLFTTKASKNTIQISDVTLAQRMLALPERLRELELTRVARRVARECFGDATGPETVRFTLAVSWSTLTAESSDAAPSARAGCVAQLLAAQLEDTWHPTIRLRIAARLLPSVEARDPRTAGAAAIEEELRELARGLEGPAARARPRDLPRTLLYGARLLDAARLAPGREARDAHLSRARAAFEEALALTGGDTDARAEALYGLFTALTALDKTDEASRAARALVCPTRYPSPTAPLALEQDHPVRWWDAWERVHNTPIGTTHPPAQSVIGTGAPGPRTWDEETRYRSPYDGCASPPDVPAPWLVDAWRGLAAYHAEGDESGPFCDNRAATALRFALASASGEAASWISLDLGRVLVHQGRYGEAARVLARVRSRPEDRELTTRAAQLLATSLTYFDLEGPSESEPRIGRSDVLDTAANPRLAEAKLAVVLERADLLPRSDAQTPHALYWMAWELEEIGMNHLAVALLERFLTRYPDHRDAPLVRWEHAETHARMAAYVRAATPESLEAARLAAESRARMAAYVGHTPWTEANASDLEALARAVELARSRP
jgi:hypothetical protein